MWKWKGMRMGMGIDASVWVFLGDCQLGCDCGGRGRRGLVAVLRLLTLAFGLPVNACYGGKLEPGTSKS